VLGNPEEVAYHQDIDSINRFCAFNKLPYLLTRELRRFTLQTREVHTARTRAVIFKKLSPLLVVKLTRILNKPIFASWLIQRALAKLTTSEGNHFVSALVRVSNVSVFAPGEEPPHMRLYIIMDGIAAVTDLSLLGVGDSWGEEEVLLGIAPSRARKTKAMSYLKVMWTNRIDIQRLAEEFPVPCHTIRLQAIWLRARRIVQEHLKSLRRGEASVAVDTPPSPLDTPCFDVSPSLILSPSLDLPGITFHDAPDAQEAASANEPAAPPAAPPSTPDRRKSGPGRASSHPVREDSHTHGTNGGERPTLSLADDIRVALGEMKDKMDRQDVIVHKALSQLNLQIKDLRQHMVF